MTVIYTISCQLPHRIRVCDDLSEELIEPRSAYEACSLVLVHDGEPVNPTDQHDSNTNQDPRLTPFQTPRFVRIHINIYIAGPGAN